MAGSAGKSGDSATALAGHLLADADPGIPGNFRIN